MSLFDKGAAIGALASELISDTPPGYVEIGGSFAEVATRFARYDDVPDESRFTDIKTQLHSAMTRVAYSGQGAAGGGEGITGNRTFADMDRIASDIDEWKGQARDSFVDNYKSAMPFVPDAQFVAVSILYSSLEAEVELWASVVNDANEVADKTLSALEAAEDKDAANFGFQMEVFAAVATITVSVITAGAAAVAITVAAAGAAVAGTGAATALAGGDAEDPESIMTSMYSALDKLDAEIVRRETEIQKGLVDLGAALDTDFAQTSFGEREYPLFRFKPPSLANGPGGLDGYTG